MQLLSSQVGGVTWERLMLVYSLAFSLRVPMHWGRGGTWKKMGRYKQPYFTGTDTYTLATQLCQCTALASSFLGLGIVDFGFSTWGP